MKINNRPNQQIHNLLMKDECKPLFQYKKDGIYIMFGTNKNTNLSLLYSENPEQVEDFLDNLLEEEISYKSKQTIKEIIKDLKNN